MFLRRNNEEMHFNQNLFVVTGGPGSGKTTALLELEKLGFPFLPEVARQIIQEQVRNHGNALPWDDRLRYTELMLERSIQSYRKHAHAPHTTFADRGIPDTLAYARLIELPHQQKIQDACNRLRYAERVFIMPPWREIYEVDEERKQDFEEALRTYDVLAKTYRDCNYDLIEVPRAGPLQRAEFILQTISSPY